MSSTGSNNSTQPAPKQMELKQDARDARLSLRRGHEETFRKELQAIASKNCRDKVVAFGECSNREGFMVVLNCRKECDESKWRNS